VCLPPKTPASRRTMARPADGGAVVRQPRARQAEGTLRLGQASQDRGRVCAHDAGHPLAPHPVSEDGARHPARCARLGDRLAQGETAGHVDTAAAHRTRQDGRPGETQGLHARPNTCETPRDARSLSRAARCACVACDAWPVPLVRAWDMRERHTAGHATGCSPLAATGGRVKPRQNRVYTSG
jgi:hypothetical protein